MTVRDYSLSGGYDNAVALDDDQIEAQMEAVWWTPQISREQMKQLVERRDAPGLWHFGIWIVLLIGSGYLAILSWGTWWAVPAFLLYGTVYSSSDARWHECGHGTPFRTRWLNELFYHISSFMTIREAYLWRWSHARHHTDTYIVGRDPEIQVKRPADLLKILMDFLYLRSGPPEVMRVIRHALGRPDADVRDYVPPAERKKMYWSSRVYLAIVGGFAIWSVVIGSFLPMMFVWLPRFYGGWLHQLLGLTQHAGLGEDTYDHRLNTRTVYVNFVYRYLYMNMNYHLEHHTTPMIPYHALPDYHAAIKDQTPPPYANLWEVYKEMIPALIKQATGDPDYTIERPLPASSPAQTTPKNVVGSARSAVAGWVKVCAADAIAEQDVMGFEFNDHVYAVYRLSADEFYASDGICTHGNAELFGGLVIDGCIECPKHNGRFDIKTGKAAQHPVREDIHTYPVVRRDDSVFIYIADR